MCLCGIILTTKTKKFSFSSTIKAKKESHPPDLITIGLRVSCLGLRVRLGSIPQLLISRG